MGASPKKGLLISIFGGFYIEVIQGYHNISLLCVILPALAG
jgi:hypothetical protein